MLILFGHRSVMAAWTNPCPWSTELIATLSPVGKTCVLGQSLHYKKYLNSNCEQKLSNTEMGNFPLSFTHLSISLSFWAMYSGLKGVSIVLIIFSKSDTNFPL